MAYPKRVALAADHAGFPLKEQVKEYLISKGVDTVDVGTFSTEPVGYPAIIRKGCGVVLEQNCPGIVFGGSGNGEAMAANKVRGIRAALCYNKESTQLAREHNNANVMSIGARLTDANIALSLVDIFLTTDYEGGRHDARINDLDTYE
ncbi:ribose 5-phosphate isomerase B [Candidatus Peregrinibacteria bacterium CG10_big_fil_rev_8_21_14_0_10_49_10]|nr:MAG: ribose 5-phosphate isomerase B [Candidatus Peregrinibacteria bacterium CG10_big_fil_rev_8_21_14_0_10_49_10]